MAKPIAKANHFAPVRRSEGDGFRCAQLILQVWVQSEHDGRARGAEPWSSRCPSSTFCNQLLTTSR